MHRLWPDERQIVPDRLFNRIAGSGYEGLDTHRLERLDGSTEQVGDSGLHVSRKNRVTSVLQLKGDVGARVTEPDGGYRTPRRDVADGGRRVQRPGYLNEHRRTDAPVDEEPRVSAAWLRDRSHIERLNASGVISRRC